MLSSDALTHSAARFVSPLWSDLALTLGMRNKAKSSLSIRASLPDRNFSMSRGIPPAPLPPLLVRELFAPVLLVRELFAPVTLVAEGLAPELLAVLVDFVIDSDSLAFSFSYKMCDQHGESPAIRCSCEQPHHCHTSEGGEKAQ